MKYSEFREAYHKRAHSGAAPTICILPREEFMELYYDIGEWCNPTQILFTYSDRMYLYGVEIRADGIAEARWIIKEVCDNCGLDCKDNREGSVCAGCGSPHIRPIRSED
jgi:hypothetical protein